MPPLPAEAPGLAESSAAVDDLQSERILDAGELPARYVAAQGTALGRAGRVHVARDADGTVWVGGDCVAVIQGEVTL